MPAIDKVKFVCIDCEFTGLDSTQDRVLEFAAVVFDLNQNYASMESLVNPECTISEDSIAIHHITPDMVKDAPTIDKVLPDLFKLVGNHILIGHGIGYDVGMLASAAERCGIPCKIQNNLMLDTLRLARLYGDCPVNSLEQLRKHFNVPHEGAHRAMSDVLVNIEVFKHLVKRYKTTEQLFDILSRPIFMTTMPLGKHKGRSMKEIPLQYLQWISNKDFDQDLIFSVRTELKRRKKGTSFNQVGNPFLNL